MSSDKAGVGAEGGKEGGKEERKERGGEGGKDLIQVIASQTLTNTDRSVIN